MLTIKPHPLLELRAFTTVFPGSLGTLCCSEYLGSFLSLDASAPLHASDAVRAAVRDLLRHGGFKPTGRSKPASEYLIKAASQGMLTSINVAVDTCNAVSLHSGLPISVIDLDLGQQPFCVDIAAHDSAYVFNQSGQTMDVGGLLCLFDAAGPCANAVKDSQRTKTHSGTRRTLSLIWGTKKLPGRADETETWYHDLLETFGASIESVHV